MANILSFSPEVMAALRQFSLVQNRAIDESSPPARVTGGRCERCGFEVALDYETPSDALRAVTLTHEFSWDTGTRCGGQVAFVSVPAERRLGDIMYAVAPNQITFLR